MAAEESAAGAARSAATMLALYSVLNVAADGADAVLDKRTVPRVDADEAASYVDADGSTQRDAMSSSLFSDFM